MNLGEAHAVINRTKVVFGAYRLTEGRPSGQYSLSLCQGVGRYGFPELMRIDRRAGNFCGPVHKNGRERRRNARWDVNATPNPQDDDKSFRRVRPMYRGESILPYIATFPLRVVVPWETSGLMSGDSERIELYPGLADWWRQAENCWEEHRSSDRLTLIGQLDYRNKMNQQFPIPKIRVVHNASGMHLAAAPVTDQRALIHKGLYWATVSSAAEAEYMCAILNSPVTTEFLRPRGRVPRKHSDRLGC